MRNSHGLFATVILLSVFTACTVKDVDTPALAGPSTLAYSLDLQANTNTLVRDGVSQARITINARDHQGQALSGRPLRAGIYIDGVEQDFGTLSTKNPVTGSTITYTAPPSNPLATTSQTVTIGVTPLDSGVYQSEFVRGLDLTLVPQGVINPSNPSLAAAFTFAPLQPKVMDTVTFNAGPTTNGGAACGVNCLYSWNFGDGTSAQGMIVTHEFRTVGTNVVTLTVTDSRGATATSPQSVNVLPGTPPVAAFTFTPTPVSVNQDTFFNADGSTAILPRRIVRFDWDFGDGTTAVGVTVTKRFRAAGSYTVVLTATDDAGTTARATQNVAVAEGLPTVSATVSGLKSGGITQLIITATAAANATIKEFSINWGDGSPIEYSNSPTQTHVYTSTQTFTIVVTAEDSVGRRRSITLSATVTPP